MHQPFLQVSKNVDLFFYLLGTGIKRSHSVPRQDYTANDSSIRCFECSKMQSFELLCESLQCRSEELFVFGGWFSCCLERQLASKCLVYHSELTVLRCSSGMIATCRVFPKKQAYICLEVLWARSIFVRFGSS